MKACALLATLFLLWSAQLEAKNYTLQSEIRGNDFFSKFSWWSYADPTEGYVE
jgi:hypothetical protein